MTLRDRIESTLRAWDRYETNCGAPPVVDFDCHPVADVAPASNRLDVRAQLVDLQAEAADTDATHLRDRIGAALAYLDALLGARPSFDDYISATQGCAATGWSDAYIESVCERAVAELDRLCIGWGPDTMTSLAAAEGAIDSADAADVIRKYADELEADVRVLVDSDATFRLSVEHVNLDEYWAYWLDGAGENVRLRINARNASFTHVQARQFALHEVLGHGLQCASLSQQCAHQDAPWVRLTSVHAQQQVLLEGLAQALPLFARPDDQPLIARVRLAHFAELVRAKLHVAVNAGTPIAECVAMAKAHVPYWGNAWLADMLADRGANPLLRSYLWAYPAGVDWFVRLADDAPADTAAEVLRASYRAPLTPDDLAALWPDGPTIGAGG